MATDIHLAVEAIVKSSSSGDEELFLLTKIISLEGQLHHLTGMGVSPDQSNSTKFNEVFKKLKKARETLEAKQSRVKVIYLKRSSACCKIQVPCDLAGKIPAKYWNVYAKSLQCEVRVNAKTIHDSSIDISRNGNGPRGIEVENVGGFNIHFYGHTSFRDGKNWVILRIDDHANQTYSKITGYDEVNTSVLLGNPGYSIFQNPDRLDALSVVCRVTEK